MDESRSRLRRLQDILDSYMPKCYVDDGKVRIVHGDGVTFAAEEEVRGIRYDRVNATGCYVNLIQMLHKCFQSFSTGYK